MSRVFDFKNDKFVQEGVRQVLQGDLSLEDALEELDADGAVYFLRLVFQGFLEKNFNLNKKTSKSISDAVVYEETGDMVIAALMGDQGAMGRLVAELPDHLASTLMEAGQGRLQSRFQKYLESNFGLSSRVAEHISSKVVREDTVDAVSRAIDGDSKAMNDLLARMPNDLAVFILQPKLQRYLVKHFSLDHSTAKDVSTQFVCKENVTAVRKAMDGDQQALKQVTQKLMVDFALVFMMRALK